MTEEWRPVVGFESRYEISDIGRVRSIDTGAVRAPSLSAGGYWSLPLYLGGGVVRNRFVHRLVATAFIPNPAGLPVVDHINRNRLDNRVVNLRWTTHRGNQLNRSVGTNNLYGHVGVGWHKRARKWRARCDGVHLGLFTDLNDAIAARDAALFHMAGSACSAAGSTLNKEHP